EGRDGKVKLDRTAKPLQRIDLAALQEVRATTIGGHGDQAEALAHELGVAYLFAPAERRWHRPHFGNALLSRVPIAHYSFAPLPSTEPGYRNVTLATLTLGRRPVTVMATHLDRGPDRAGQLKRVLAMFERCPPPCILLGDLNTTANDPDLARVLARDDVLAPAP